MDSPNILQTSDGTNASSQAFVQMASIPFENKWACSHLEKRQVLVEAIIDATQSRGAGGRPWKQARRSAVCWAVGVSHPVLGSGALRSGIRGGSMLGRAALIVPQTYRVEPGVGG